MDPSEDLSYTTPSTTTEIVTLPTGAELAVEYKVTAGELLIAVLLTTLISVFVAHWVSRLVFRRGG